MLRGPPPVFAIKLCAATHNPRPRQYTPRRLAGRKLPDLPPATGWAMLGQSRRGPTNKGDTPCS